MAFNTIMTAISGHLGKYYESIAWILNTSAGGFYFLTKADAGKIDIFLFQNILITGSAHSPTTATTSCSKQIMWYEVTIPSPLP